MYYGVAKDYTIQLFRHVKASMLILHLFKKLLPDLESFSSVLNIYIYIYIYIYIDFIYRGSLFSIFYNANLP